jgi:hypothetical protein
MLINVTNLKRTSVRYLGLALLKMGKPFTSVGNWFWRKPKKKSTVNKSGNYTKPALRKRIFNRIMAGSKGGKPGQWSARKAQMLAVAYKKAGGGYKTKKA